MKELEEGDKCGFPDCDGKMVWPRGENCSCHIAPPCGSCVNVELTCNKCHRTAREISAALESEEMK